jgi:hypothetical protein
MVMGVVGFCFEVDCHMMAVKVPPSAAVPYYGG